MTEDDIAGNKEAKIKRAAEKAKAGKEEAPAEGATPEAGAEGEETPPAEGGEADTTEV